MGTQVIVETLLHNNGLITLVQQWPNGIIAHCCTTVTLDDISAAMTNVMRHEEHLWMSVYSEESTFPILSSYTDYYQPVTSGGFTINYSQAFNLCYYV
jgi:hypothetical protein